MRAIGMAAAAVLVWSGAAFEAQAQNMRALVVSSCGALPAQFKAGNPAPLTVDTTGKLCMGASGSVAPLTVRSLAVLTGLAVSSCGSSTYKAGRAGPLTIDLNGNAC